MCLTATFQWVQVTLRIRFRYAFSRAGCTSFFVFRDKGTLATRQSDTHRGSDWSACFTPTVARFLASKTAVLTSTFKNDQALIRQNTRCEIKRGV